MAYDGVLKRNQVDLTNSTSTDSTAALPTVSALNFYTSFANPTSTFYTWNSSLPSSFDMFISGRSAFYIGRASELFALQAQNPNLNFDVMELFQPEGAVRPTTYGSFIAAGMMKFKFGF